MGKPHKKLDLWNTAMELAVAVYKITELFPKEERCSLTDQIRRAVSSVSGNVAEGTARQTKKEFINYLHMAQGSLSELGYAPRTFQTAWVSRTRELGIL